MQKPPATLTADSSTAAAASAPLQPAGSSPPFITCSPPSAVMPLTALVTDMSGECSAGATPPTTWKPTMQASTKVVTRPSCAALGLAAPMASSAASASATMSASLSVRWKAAAEAEGAAAMTEAAGAGAAAAGAGAAALGLAAAAGGSALGSGGSGHTAAPPRVTSAPRTASSASGSTRNTLALESPKLSTKLVTLLANMALDWPAQRLVRSV